MIPVQHRLKMPATPYQEMLRQFGCELRVAIPAIVVSFDAGDATHAPTVSVQPAIREVILQDAVPTILELPILDAVPVVIPQGGNWLLTFPIAAGDECLVVFADMGIDVWFQNGGVQKQPDGKKFRHDLGDAFAIFGTRSNPRGLADYSTDSAQLRSFDGTVVIDLASDSMSLTAPAVTIGDSGGSAAPLVKQAFFDWFVTNVVPFLTAHGYVGPPPPVDSVTTVLEAD